jgi:hypothetical protein
MLQVVVQGAVGCWHRSVFFAAPGVLHPGPPWTPEARQSCADADLSCAASERAPRRPRRRLRHACPLGTRAVPQQPARGPGPGRPGGSLRPCRSGRLVYVITARAGGGRAALLPERGRGGRRIGLLRGKGPRRARGGGGRAGVRRVRGRPGVGGHCAAKGQGARRPLCRPGPALRSLRARGETVLWRRGGGLCQCEPEPAACACARPGRARWVARAGQARASPGAASAPEPAASARASRGRWTLKGTLTGP